MTRIKTLILFLCIIVIVHFSDLNPIWLWPWYRETVGVWLFRDSGFGLSLFFIAMITGLIIVGPDNKQRFE